MTVAVVKSRTQTFYDGYWPNNLPDPRKTREHVISIVPDSGYQLALDGGCGTGVCTLALAELAGRVVGLDISYGSLRTAADLAQKAAASNIEFCHGSLLQLPFSCRTFDLVFSWGVIHHTSNPLRALDELVRVLRPSGTLILAVYLRTNLTFVHEGIRHLCVRSPNKLRPVILGGFANLVRLGERMGRNNNVRNDNILVESQVEDWYFVPEKHFFTIDQMRGYFFERGLSYEVICEQTGRYRSSSNFIVRGVKR